VKVGFVFVVFSSSSGLPRRQGEKESSRRQAVGSLFFKRGCSSTACAASVLVCLASRGGEEVGKTESTASVSMLCLRETLKNSLPMAIPKRRPKFVFAIHSQTGGLAMLGAQICASFCFLQERIFYSYGPAHKPPTQPSSFVPDCGWGGAALSLLNSSGLQGPDCIFVIFFRLCSVIVEDLVVFSYFFGSSM
jgi:hypothetical protein